MLKRNVVVIERLLREVEQKAEFYLCPVVYYEILRGLLYRDAKRQLAEFEMLAATLRWKDFERDIWEEQQPFGQTCAGKVTESVATMTC